MAFIIASNRCLNNNFQFDYHMIFCLAIVIRNKFSFKLAKFKLEINKSICYLIGLSGLRLGSVEGSNTVRISSHTSYLKKILKNKKLQSFNLSPFFCDNFENTDETFNKLNFYYQSSTHQSTIYFNNLILGFIILFILFSVLILLEENDSFYNLSAISFLLLVTFNLLIIIFSHNLAKQFLTNQNLVFSNTYFTNY